MNSSVEKISQTQRKITITVPQASLAGYKNRALQKVGGKAKIKGFRPGKVPANMLEKFYGSEISYETLNFVLGDSYIKSLQENNIIPLSDPSFDDAGPVDFTKDYVYSVTVEVRPEFELKNYKGLEVKKQAVEIADNEVQAELEKLQQNLAQLVTADDDAVVADGLVATMDFTGTLDGVPFPGGAAKDHVLELGQGHFLKEFEEKMAGMKKGEERTIDVTFPENYFEKNLAGKVAQFAIKLTQLHKKSLPAIDDEMAKDIGKESLEDLKKEMRELITKRKEAANRSENAKLLRERLLNDYDFEVPPSFLKSTGDADGEIPDAEQVKKREQEIRLQFVLQEVASKEDIKVERQDVEKRMSLLSQVYRQPLAEIRKFYADENHLRGLVAQLRADKALDFIVDNAKLV